MRELLKQWMVLEVLFVKREICYAECFLEICRIPEGEISIISRMEQRRFTAYIRQGNIRIQKRYTIRYIVFIQIINSFRSNLKRLLWKIPIPVMSLEYGGDRTVKEQVSDL